MRRILMLLVLVLSMTILTGCFEGVYIEPGEMSVVFENPRYVGSSFYIDVFITNGQEIDEFVSYMEFDIYSDDDELYIAGAGFDIDETVPANGHIEVELEFSDEFVFANESVFSKSGYDIDSVILYFWFNE
ncbi:MAG: hypothetical protein KAH16_02810 [Candidatus Izimaplasma sp.]|nr:hypothetical protein [Candidatus Izimaplasma bacterium]